ncbi:hypothetical protein M413DRAFT_409020 [Hebeloma cylindrosporum]|uniref:ubiquitinyl hydrolase 1 n=1 Tax=Hebeloma cylindrosporum TaxID=76867 RepID=A0A0C3CFE8_HEBCY|nr:hypothetical protein M413DRAFT_409020 [Hebeloma cylindrosporum h7]
MANSNSEPPSLEDTLYILNHVFLPPKLPQADDHEANRDVVLCRLVYDSSKEFSTLLSQSQQAQWSSVIQMLKNLLESTQVLDQNLLIRKILRLEIGGQYFSGMYDVLLRSFSPLSDPGVFVFHIRLQNAALILRRLQDSMVFEVFEVSPDPEAVMTVQGKLICSYPGPAVELPLDVAQDPAFVEQLVSFLMHMDVDRLPAAQATTTKARSKVPETRGTTHPRYISQLLIMVLRGMGSEATVNRITKRIADDVCWQKAENPWRRSPLWLVLRVAIQTTADCRETYKAFVVFLQVKLLQLFVDYDLSTELLHVTRVKTSRRVHKLGDSASSQLLQTVMAVSQTIEERLQGRWSEEQDLQASSSSYIPDPTAFEEDTTISLVGSRAYLSKVLSHNPSVDARSQFKPSHSSRILDIHDFRQLYPDRITKAVQVDSRIALADFELIVQERLDDWVTENSQNDSACETLGSCLEQYTSAAKTIYASNPEDESLMLLTIMELWVALDTIAGIQCPLLLSYSPVIPSSFLDPLLLRRAKSLERAARIELHLRRRRTKATITTSIYSDGFEKDTFSVRYFTASSTLRAIRDSIERHAAEMRSKKRIELLEANAKHKLLTEEIARRSCKYIEDDWGYISHSRWSCERCALQEEADAMRITVEEWPLPDRLNESAGFVFELNCPPVFAIWRTWTYQILRDVGMVHVSVGKDSSFDPEALVENYAGLSTWSKQGTSGRITLGSETKSFLKAHYHNRRIPAAEDSICVNNGLRFKLYDSRKGEHVRSTFDLNLDSYCTLRLPADRGDIYRHLQYSVTHTTYTHNETIVSQGDCPMNLSIHEQLAFSNLRCGSLLQWKNIARELRTKILTFSREEVHTLFTQAAWQIGPLSKDGAFREWHFELGVPEFALTLTREAKELLSHVEANWIEGTTVKTISCVLLYLISRLLAATPDAHGEIQRDGYQLLRKARQVTHTWMREIVLKLQDVVDAQQASELQRRACDMAATCRATFDVEGGSHLAALLCSPADVAIAIECAIVIHDNTPPHLGCSFPDFQKLLHRDHRLSHFLEGPLVELIKRDKSGLNTAITSVWSSYRPGAEGWRLLDSPNSRWLTSFTAPLSGQRAQEVHYNILTGKLLVDGKPLGRLPQEIVRHSTYSRIFGQKILDVIPADMSGMDYATRSLVYGYQVFFALRGSSQNLIIRASCPDKTLELIPHHILLGDFPTFFIEEHAHWMDVQSGEVEFRPLDRLWDSSPQNWRLQFFPGLLSRMIHSASETRHLLDIRSRTFQGIASRILPLERSEYLTIVLDVASHVVSIELPRFRLSFFVRNGELQSKSMQGMVVDDKQSTGTMIGLSSQLVLRHKDPQFSSLPRSRCVIIPHGNVHHSLSPDKNHVRVHISTSMRRVTWYKYDIDADLGLLVGGVNLTSRLFRIYLHALCSSPLPDPLTGQTGTDHALQELGAAACFSFQSLTSADVELLQLIGNLTPHRYYYPPHLRVMQTIKWSLQIPTLSQHGLFDIAVRKIMQHAQSLTIFSGPKENKPVDLKYNFEGNSHLNDRATQRNAAYNEAAIDAAANFDGRYESRDSPHVPDYNSDGIEALNTSRLVFAWPVGLTRDLGSSELLETFKRWGNMSGPLEGTSLMYSREWLDLVLPEKWLSIYDLCRHTGESASKYKLVFSFAAVAYDSPSLRQYIPVFLAFATIRKSELIEPPKHPSYDLKVGFEPPRNRVRSMIISGTKGFADSPAARLSLRSHESKKELRSRQSKHYDEHISRRTNDVLERLMMESDSSYPQSPFREASDPNWFNTKEIMGQVREYFASCSRNRDLRSFASQVTTILKANYRTSPLTSKVLRFGFVRHFDIRTRQPHTTFTLTRLLSLRLDSAPLLRPSHEVGTSAHIHSRPLGQPLDTSDLEKLISQFRSKSHSKLTPLYSERLERSRKELDGEQAPALSKQLPPVNECLAYRDQCQDRLHTNFSLIRSALAPSTATERILAHAGLWPRVHHPNVSLSPEWTRILIAFAEAFIEYQYSQRLLSFALQSDVEKYFKELDNASFNRQDARQIPDWLLIQIQGNFMTRAIQYDVAKEMITPSSNNSTILQLNMGEGKSHVIVPLVATALADSEKLARVVVLKPLAGQMFHLLVERLSGLANRRIFYLPFSRDVAMNSRQIQLIHHLFQECARVRGVLVAQPEHILSFRLMVIDRTLSSGSPLDDVARKLQETHKWVSSTSRDILTRAMNSSMSGTSSYTMGQQQPLDGGQDRWTTTQKVFDIVRRHIGKLHNEFPTEVELLGENCEAKFPHIRLLGTSESASKALISHIAEDALNGEVDNLTFVNLTPGSDLRTAVLRFIKEQGRYGKSGHWKGLLLLRGLLAHGILVHVLRQRRWRVDYGLDLKRSLLAVPYRAKDVPSLRSEFGHPDIAVCLTCLSYYYGGLTTSQARECFDLLNKLDNPPLEYEEWVRRGANGVPESLRQLIGVNTKDVQKFTNEIIPIFQHNQATIDFFLSQVVFPKEAKEFPSKLGTSGWDLVERKANFTTGFSGTNDNSDLLPTSITPNDPVNQLRTNALVLWYLLQAKNDRYVCAQDAGGQPCTATQFLELLIQEPKEMLEMTNRQLVAYWLSLRKDVAAGVFFDDMDNLSVLTRDGVVESFYSSSFSQLLDQCIVYLDDAHTRGTDLKLPLNFRAMVTLGPKVTKDRLVQGCMRMRKLGHGQSIVFCAPPEVDRRIREAEGVDSVKVIDVLSWVMSNTCIDIEHHIPHWVQQGLDFHRRQSGDAAFAASDSDVETLKESWLQPAARSLDEMYDARSHDGA